MIRVAVVLGACALAAATVPGQERALPLRHGTHGAAEYVPRPLRGFDVRLGPGVVQGELEGPLTDALDRDLAAVAERVPAASLAALQRVPIFVSSNDPVAPCACYHVSGEWLGARGYDPAKARAVEIASGARYLEDRALQPSLLLHELAHALHHRELSAHDDRLAAARDAAEAAGRLQAVLRSSGRVDRHYGLTSAAEYFAETSEALFGVNDFFPFVRAELEAIDPAGAALALALWRGEAPPPMDAGPDDANDLEALASAEIHRLHGAFEVWFGGAGEEDFSPIDGALAPGFAMVTPGGDVVERAALVERLRAARGRRDVRLEVTIDRTTRLDPTTVLVLYRERQREAGGDARVILSSAVLRRDPAAPGGMRWLHVHETLGRD